MARQLILRTTIHDCEVQTFRAGGPGGQNQNKRNTGVRIIHRPSGAIGESREERSQLQNKQRAFSRMAKSAEYNLWRMKMIGREELPLTASSERIRTYNLVDRYVKDHRTKQTSSKVTAILDGDIDLLYGKDS